MELGTRPVIVPPDQPGASHRSGAVGQRRARFRRRVVACGSLLAVTILVAGVLGARAASRSPDEVSGDTPVYTVGTPKGGISELWRYVFSWRGLPVGHVTIAGTETEEAGERLMRVRVAGRTNSFIDLLWRYRLEAGGALHLDPIAPASYYAHEVESSKQATTRIDFDRTRRVTTFRKKGDKVKQYEFEAPNTYEFLSTIWLLLNIEYELGKTYRVDAITGASRYLLEVSVEGREVVHLDGMPIETYRLRAITQELTDPKNEIATKHRETALWVNTDWPRRLLRADVSTKWGAVRLELTSVEDIAELPPIDVMHTRPPASNTGNKLRPYGTARPLGP
jgi:hypothetical protein